MKMRSGGASPAGESPWELDRRHVLHPWEHFASFERDGALIVDRGEGAYLYDANGRRYYDAVGG